jgi:hypothetical protein
VEDIFFISVKERERERERKRKRKRQVMLLREWFGVPRHREK